VARGKKGERAGQGGTYHRSVTSHYLRLSIPVLAVISFLPLCFGPFKFGVGLEFSFLPLGFVEVDNGESTVSG